MKAEEHGATILVPDGKVRIDYNGLTPFIVKDPQGVDMLDAIQQLGVDTSGLTAIEPNETINLKGVSVTAYSGEHRTPDESSAEGIYDTPVDWYYVNVSGFGLLHTGDGFLYDNVPDFSAKRIDVLMIHYTDELTCEALYKMVPNAKVMLPLHLHELGHGREMVLDIGMFKNALDQYDHGYLQLTYVQPNPTPMRYVPMIWGESLELGNASP